MHVKRDDESTGACGSMCCVILVGLRTANRENMAVDPSWLKAQDWRHQTDAEQHALVASGHGTSAGVRVKSESAWILGITLAKTL